MMQSEPGLRGFKAVFTTIGVSYVLLASSMLMRGVGVMADFAVPEGVVHSPVFEDFFLFFYQLMVVLGVITVMLGRVTAARSQRFVALAFCVLNIVLTLRDVSTSDSGLGNHLYRGSATLIPVFIDLAFALAFGTLACIGLTDIRRRPP